MTKSASNAVAAYWTHYTSMCNSKVERFLQSLTVIFFLLSGIAFIESSNYGG